MEQTEVSVLWAAFIVRYNDEFMDIFNSYCDRILEVLKDLDASLIADGDVLLSEKLEKSVVDTLWNDGKGNVSIGREGKIKQFINAIRAEL